MSERIHEAIKAYKKALRDPGANKWGDELERIVEAYDLTAVELLDYLGDEHKLALHETIDRACRAIENYAEDDVVLRILREEVE
jgi:hypothetical protein